MRHRQTALGLALIGLLGGGVATAAVAQDATPVPPDDRTAAAVIADAAGHVVGVALLTQQPDGSITVMVTAAGLEAGERGMHVHETGVCDPTGERAFSSAGDHFNPTGAEHGDHAGDLGNLDVDEDGIGRFDETTDAFTLTGGNAGLLDSDGSAIMIHAERDENDPEGESYGARIACGVISASVAAAETEVATPTS